MNMDTIHTLRSAEVFQSGRLAGYLEEKENGRWVFAYEKAYDGIPVSLTLPLRKEPYPFNVFPPVFDGLLPEGPQLEALLRTHKIDRQDCFKQLMTVGEDLVGSLSVRQKMDVQSSEIELQA